MKYIKKFFLPLVFLGVSFSTTGCGNTNVVQKNNIDIQEYDDLVGGETLKKLVRSSEKTGIEYSRTFLQAYEKEATKTIHRLRFATAIKVTSSVETVKIKVEVDGNTTYKDVKTVYQGLMVNDKAYYYNPEDDSKLSEELINEDYYFAVYQIDIIDDLSYLDKEYKCSTSVNNEKYNEYVETSFDDASTKVEGKCVEKIYDTDESTVIGTKIYKKHSMDAGQVIREATCCSDGEILFTCTRCNETETQVIPATDEHPYDYSKKEISWTGDQATVVAPCSTEGCASTLTETKQGSYVKDTNATCSDPEKGHYEVTFNNTNFGSARTDANSVEKGSPKGHDYGSLIPQVDAYRETAGVKAHYQCSECHGYFDSEKNEVNESSLVIPAPAKSFSANTNFDWDFKTPIEAGSTITMDLKFVDGDANSKIVVQLFGAKDDGSCDWSNCFGAFTIFSDRISDNPAGVSLMKCDDGYVRVTFVLDSITKKSGTPNGVAKIFFDGRYTNVGGYVEVNSNVAAHTKGAELIPAKAAGPHGDDGYQAHYECTGCDDYWFNESGALCKKEDLTIASKAIKYAPPATGDTLAEFKNLGNITDKVSIDIHFDNPSKHQEVGINFYESAWDNYYGTFWVDCDDSGVYFEGDYEGITLDELTDGWWRVTAYPSALNKFSQDKKDIDQKHSIDFIWIKGPGTVSNRGSGMFELNSAFEGTVPSTKVYSFSGEKYTIDRTFLKGEIINLDFKIKNETKINFALLTGWSSCFTFNVKPNGTLEDQKNGVQIFKLNNELAGYPTLEGTWYRVIIDTNYIAATAAFTTINRIGGNKWNGAEYDMMINSPYTTDGWYTIAGGSSNTKIEFKIPTPLAIRDGDGQLFDKALYFEVKAVGTGKAYVSPMDYDWHNCGKYVLTFTDGALTDRVVQGSANKWPKVTDLGNGVYGLTLALSELPGDGLANASSVGFFYNGDGVLANGLSEFSINVFSLKLVEIPA